MELETKINAIRKLVVVIVSITLIGCASFNLDDCNMVYSQSNYKKFVDKCSTFQDAATEYKLYTIYSDGLSGQVDHSLANYYLGLSAQKGYSVAQSKVCEGYIDGSIGGVVNYERAIYWCSRAMQNGDQKAKWFLGKAYFLSNNYKSAIPLLNVNAVNGSAEYQYMLAISMIKNNYDQNVSYDWLRKAYNQNYAPASLYVTNLKEDSQQDLINVYFKSDITYNDALGVFYYQDKNFAAAIIKLKPRATRGFASYQYMLADSMKKLNKPADEWMFWMKKAYVQKYPPALEFASKQNGKYGKCNFEDAFFRSSLSYDEALQACKDFNDGNVTSSTVFMNIKKAWRSF